VKSRNIVVIIVIAALLVAYYWLGTGYLQERRQNSTLSANISETMLALAALPKPDPDRQQRLEEVRAELDMALSIFPSEPNTTQIIDAILQTAEDIGLKAIPLVTRPWVTETIDDYPVAVFRLNLVATGTSAQFADFLDYLENGETETIVIEYLTIYREDETPLQESLAESPARILADLDIAIYAQAPEDE
jgi:Tfp pilus assembly protein PilO